MEDFFFGLVVVGYFIFSVVYPLRTGKKSM